MIQELGNAIDHTRVPRSALASSVTQPRSSFCIGGVTVSVSGDHSEDVALTPALQPFRAELSRAALNIKVEWLLDLSPARGGKLFDSGTTWQLYETASGFQFDFKAPAFGERPYKRLWADENFCRMTLQMSERAFSGCRQCADPLGYPLDELLIMHRLTQEKAIELHGCGIVRAGVGNLFVGHSGAGKSTTTRLWTSCQDVEVLSDDRIIVRSATPGEVPACDRTNAIPCLRLRAGFASRNNHSAPVESPMRMYGTPWHGEAMFASPNSSPLSRIVILQHGHGNVITPLSKSQAVAELFARSFVPFHRHEYVDSALSFLEELASSVPCYRYSFEPDRRAVDKILQLND